MARFTGGWVKIYRSLEEHPSGSTHALMGLFLDLLLMASRYESKVLRDGKLATIKPGDVLTSVVELAVRGECSLSTMRRRLGLLELTGSIVQNVTHRGRIITICNWEEYQRDDSDDWRTPDALLTDSRRTHGHVLENARIQEEKKKTFLSPAEPDDPSPQQLATLWNETAHGLLPRVQVPSLKAGQKRFKAAKARLLENPDLGYWRGVIARMNASPFCRGEKSAWRASFDFLIQPETHIKVLEGKYDPAGNSAAPQQMTVARAHELAAANRKEHGYD